MRTFILIIFFSMATAETLKNPEFILVEKHGDIEVREYSEYVIAKTSISQSDMELNNNMFRTLAGYIFGGNNKSQSIPMTAPVITKNDESSYDMIFFMLDANKPEDLPLPNSNNVSIEMMDLGRTISIAFGMWATDSRVEYYKRKLDKHIKDNNIQIISPLMVAQYNSPWAMPPFRKNELIYKIN